MNESPINLPGYTSPVNQLFSLGQPKGHDFILDYAALGITSEHIPELLRMVADGELHNAPGKSRLVWSPVHAWRALAELKAASAVAPLLDLLPRIDKHNDDWVSTEVPRALGEIGHPALAPVTAYLTDATHDDWAREAAAKALAELGTRHPDLRAECVVRLSAQLEKFAEQSETLNAFLVSVLLDLKAREALPIIERAFAGGHVDESVAGDYEDVEIDLGLKTQREHPPKPNKLSELGDKLRALAAINQNQYPGADPDGVTGLNGSKLYLNPGKVGRNDPCPCGSGKKYKKCCGKV